MAIPVIGSPLVLNVVTGVNFQYRIKASGQPYAFDADPLPIKTDVDNDTGAFKGRVKDAGVHSVTISATNDDGTGTAVLVITAVTGAPGSDNGQVTVYQAKYWNDLDATERIDYADLDSAGQPILAFNQGAIGEDQLKPNTFEIKVDAIGGFGRILQVTLPTDIIFTSQPVVPQRLGTLAAVGVTAGDPVICDNFIRPTGGQDAAHDGGPNGDTDPPVALYIYAGVEVDDVVTFYGYTSTGTVTILQGSRINARAFTL
jgi:hypothetical protein